MIKLLITAICLSGISGFCGEIADYHLKHPTFPGIPGVTSTNHAITEIGIERTACFGKCPIYTFIIKSDGTFRYKGVQYVERIGEFTGTIPIADFYPLAKLINDSDYMSLPNNFSRPVTDNSTVYTLVVSNGERKTISDYAAAGPKKLREVEHSIDDLLLKAKWDEPKKSSP